MNNQLKKDLCDIVKALDDLAVKHNIQYITANSGRRDGHAGVTIDIKGNNQHESFEYWRDKKRLTKNIVEEIK